MIDVEIRNASLYTKTQAAFSIFDNLKRRFVKPAIGVTHGPSFRAHAGLSQKIEGPIDFFYLSLSGNMA